MPDPLHAESITVTTRVATGPDENGEPSYQDTVTTVDGCNVQPIIAMGDALFEQTTITPRWKVCGPDGQFISDLVNGDALITWRAKQYKPNGAVQDYHTADGLGEHTEFYMLEA